MCGATKQDDRRRFSACRLEDWTGIPILKMDEKTSGSCWSVTTKAVIGIAGLMLLTWLIGGGVETGAILAAG